MTSIPFFQVDAFADALNELALSSSFSFSNF